MDALMEDEESPFSYHALLEELPPDVMKNVLSFLFLDELDVLSLVSRQINEGVMGADHLHMNQSIIHTSHGSHEAHITEAGMRKLLQRYNSLNVLHLHGLASVGDRLFSILNESPSASTLHRISLHGCRLSYWCPTSLQLQHLTHVTITGGSIRVGFGAFIASSLMLKSLSIGQCSSLQDENVADITGRLHNTLASLSLHQCLRVKKPVLQFDRLTSLNLMGCFALSDLPNFQCPALKSLVLSFCFRLEGKQIQHIVDSLPEIEHLALVKCPLLHELKILSDTLQSLSVSLSNNLRVLSLCTPNLQTVEATSCTSLLSFQLDSQCIQELKLTMLPLQNAHVAAPSLTRLKLCGCQSLVDAQFLCPNLRFVDICGTPLSPNLFRGKVKVLKHGVTSMPDPAFVM
mmetsp:Transcript_29137/g.48173  ORF Transcript_29137/g.48173 Transcript_29137/m.48173 type:complete len:403 (-) Transcript_29137:6-1214(-)